MPPNGANREHYQNARVDQLIDGIRTEMDREKRKELCSELQKILAEDGPYVPLWFTDVVSVHRREMGQVAIGPTGGYEWGQDQGNRIAPGLNPEWQTAKERNVRGVRIKTESLAWSEPDRPAFGCKPRPPWG
jgi:ABC-type oligopeptide transport system substrate-binding subunit